MVKKSDNKFSIQKDGGTVPNKIFDYINQNFENGFLSDINSFKDKNGKLVYTVDISFDNNLYHMRFDSNGTLLNRVVEPLLQLLDEEDYLDMD
jgi:hypothetical protein